MMTMTEYVSIRVPFDEKTSLKLPQGTVTIVDHMISIVDHRGVHSQFIQGFDIIADEWLTPEMATELAECRKRGFKPPLPSWLKAGA
jgi:hypothetical protein